MRAALIRHVGQGSYVLPAACFGLTAEELAAFTGHIVPDRGTGTDASDDADPFREGEGGGEPSDVAEMLDELPGQRQAA